MSKKQNEIIETEKPKPLAKRGGKEINPVSTDDEFAFLEYQEEVKRSKEAKRNRLLLVLLSIVVFLLGLGLFSTIAVNVYQMWPIGGIVIGIVLFVAYLILFVIIVVSIYKKQSFDLEFKKKKNGVNSERKNNLVRWDIATNIYEQANLIGGLYQFKEDDPNYIRLQFLVENHSKAKDGYKAQSSKELGDILSHLITKDGRIYKAAKKMIWKEAISCGALTAISQSTMIDAGIVAMKNMQLIKNIIWLYGFRPTDQEMVKLTFKVIKNVSLSIGLNNMPKGVNFASKLLSKDSSNFLVQMLGSVIDMGSQLLGNGVMTYLIGRQTVDTMLREYRVQDLFRIQVANREELLLPTGQTVFKELNGEIKEAIVVNQKAAIPEPVEVKVVEEEEPERKHRSLGEAIRDWKIFQDIKNRHK